MTPTQETEILKHTSKRELLNKYEGLKSAYSKVMSRYTNLKADILIIKKQLENITNNINISNSTVKSSSIITYTKGGNKNRRVKRT